MRHIAPLVAALGLACCSSAVLAERYSCSGMVTQVTVDPTGAVNASFSFSSGAMEWQWVCSLNVDSQGGTPAACKSILALLTAAHLTGKRTQMWFDHPTVGQCSATPWSALSNMGWYWGPSISP
jgi:hypothetical protein